MKAEIISIGTELLLGHVVNTNASYLAREMAGLGIELTHQQVVGDNYDRLCAALELASGRADLIITTGGLGPTGDDLSKQAVAGFAGLPMVEDALSSQRLKDWFGRDVGKTNQGSQAMFPQGSIVLPNSRGTAPGCMVPLGEDKFVILLPGPPAEMRAMFDSGVKPFLLDRTRSCICSVMIRTFGIGEGVAAEKLGELLEGANPSAATYTTGGEMFVKVTARAGSREEAMELAAPLVDRIRQRLGDVVYGLDVPSLADVVVKKLIALGVSLTLAESCTGGLAARLLTDIPGSSKIFSLGLVTYANWAKEEILGVPGEVLARYGAVSPQTAMAMAKNARRVGKSSLGIGITGIAGPGGGSDDKPVGLVYVCLADEKKCWLRKLLSPIPERERIRGRAAGHALDLVRRYLDGLPMLDDPGLCQ